VIMQILVEELLCQAVMGHISVLQCLLSGAMASLSKENGSLATCLVLGIPPGVATAGPGACRAEARGRGRLG
jgi:hypothetical protein